MEASSVVGRVFLKTEIQMGYWATVYWSYIHDKLENYLHMEDIKEDPEIGT